MSEERVQPPGKRTLLKKCAECGLSPLPEDVTHWWGASVEDMQSDLCIMCRTRLGRMDFKHKDKATLFYAPKLEGLPATCVKEYLLSRRMRDLARHTECSNGTAFITDGERIWKWSHFPWNATSPLSWDVFLKSWPTWEFYKHVESAKPARISPKVIPFEHIKV